MHYPITRHTILPFLRRYVNSVKGWEHLPDTGPFIVVANHISQTDPLFIISSLFKKYKSKIHYLAIRGDYGQFIEQQIARKWAGCILIDPENPSKSLEVAHDYIKRDRLIGIFPEGVRRPEADRLGRGKTGAVRLGLKARVPILPIGVKTKGEKHRLIRGRDRSKPYDAVAQFILKGQRSDLVIGRPISYHEHYNKDADYELLRSLTDDMMRKISELCGQPYEY